MTINQLNSTRRLLALAGAAICIAILLFTIDSLTSRLREKFNVINLVAGSSEEITGLMPENATSLADLTTRSSSTLITLTPHETFTGFWLGGEMWRATLQTTPSTPPGSYDLSLNTHNNTSQPPVLVYRVQIFPNTKSLNLASPSLTASHLGLSPVRLALSLLPILALILAINYTLGLAHDRLLAAQGQAEIFMVRENNGYIEIAFALGSNHGLTPNSTITISSPTNPNLATATVITTLPRDSIARLTLAEAQAANIHPGLIASISRPA